MSTETEDEREDERWHEAMLEARKDYDSLHPKPLPRCKDRMCGALDCPTCQGEAAARDYLLKMKQDDCEHTELDDHGICLECGADCFDRLIDAAEWRRDALEDR